MNGTLGSGLAPQIRVQAKPARSAQTTVITLVRRALMLMRAIMTLLVKRVRSAIGSVYKLERCCYVQHGSNGNLHSH